MPGISQPNDLVSKRDSGKVRSSTLFRIRRQERRLELGGKFLIRSFLYVEAWVSSRFLSLQNEIPILSDPEVLPSRFHFLIESSLLG